MEMVLVKESSLEPDSTKEDAIAALEEVLKDCIKEGILADYLTRKGTEIINMFLDEYDYDTDIAVQREEAMEQGAQQQAIQAAINLLKMQVLSPKQIAQAQGLPLQKVLELQEEIKVKA